MIEDKEIPPTLSDEELIRDFEFMIREGEDLKGDSSRIAKAYTAILSRFASLRAEALRWEKQAEQYSEDYATLRAELNAATAVRNAALEKAVSLNQEVNDLKGTASALRASRESLVKALETYGGHIRGPKICDLLKSLNFPCNCGFDAALSQIQKDGAVC